jgi:hypothetical protein
MDIGLIMDRSNSIFKAGLSKTRKFVTDLVDNFDLSPDGAEFSIIQFNGVVDGLLPFSYNRNDIIDAGNKLGFSKGSTFTGGAINFFIDNYLKNSRSLATKYLVLITDGEPTKGVRLTKKTKTSPIQYTYDQIDRMKELYPGIKIISIGLGGFDKQFLNNISSKDKDGNPLVFSINGIFDLEFILYSLTSEICTEGEFTRHPTSIPTRSPSVSPTTCSQNCETIRKNKQCKKSNCGCDWVRNKGNRPSCRKVNSD